MENPGKAHLRLVDGLTSGDIEAEFQPLPHYPWSSRPSHLPLDIEECATALYLAEGVIGRAAERLKVEPLKLTRLIARSPRLTRLHGELVSLLNDKVHEEYMRAFADEDSRRREWAASKVAQTKGFQSHPLAPNSQVSPTISLSASGAREITFRWRTDADDAISTTYEEKETDDSGGGEV